MNYPGPLRYGIAASFPLYKVTQRHSVVSWTNTAPVNITYSVHCIRSPYFYTNINNPCAGLLQALRDPGGLGYKISRQSAYEGGKVVSPTHRPPSPQGNIPGTHLCYRPSLPHSEGLCQWKIPGKPSGIEPATFRIVAHCSTNCATTWCTNTRAW
jgi:hypothetical protein